MSSPPVRVSNPPPADLYPLAVENENLWNRLLKAMSRRQMYSPRSTGGLTVINFSGNTAAQGLNTYNATTPVPMASGQGYDYLTDINIWSRGSVSSAGVVTPNTTAIFIMSQGGAPITLAPGESFTLRNKNPTQLSLLAAATPSSTDSVMIFW